MQNCSAMRYFIFVKDQIWHRADMIRVVKVNAILAGYYWKQRTEQNAAGQKRCYNDETPLEPANLDGPQKCDGHVNRERVSVETQEFQEARSWGRLKKKRWIKNKNY